MRSKNDIGAAQILENARKEHEIVRLLIKQWKGTSLAGLKLLIKAADDFKRKFKDLHDYYFDVSLDLLKVLEGYPKQWDICILNWLHKNFGIFSEFESVAKSQERRMEIIKRFGDELVPKVGASKQARINRKPQVTKSQKHKFLSKIRGKDGGEDFWGVQYPKPPTPFEQYASLVAKFLLNHPELCPNCFEKHKLENCTNIQPKPKDNLAAYVRVDFGKIFRMKVPTWLMSYAKSFPQPSNQ